MLSQDLALDRAAVAEARRQLAPLQCCGIAWDMLLPWTSDCMYYAMHWYMLGVQSQITDSYRHPAVVDNVSLCMVMRESEEPVCQVMKPNYELNLKCCQDMPDRRTAI